jgi:chromosome segregation ATPase
VTELRKALLNASEAVYAAQQELRVERQRRMVLEGERDRAVTGIRSLHTILGDKQVESRVESQRSQRIIDETREELRACKAQLQASEEHSNTLREQLATERATQTATLEELTRCQKECAELRRHLREAKEYARRRRDEVKKADYFIEGALSAFLREASPFAAQWRGQQLSTAEQEVEDEVEYSDSRREVDVLRYSGQVQEPPSASSGPNSDSHALSPSIIPTTHSTHYRLETSPSPSGIGIRWNK